MKTHLLDMLVQINRANSLPLLLKCDVHHFQPARPPAVTPDNAVISRPPLRMHVPQPVPDLRNFHAVGKGSGNCIEVISGTQEMYT